MQRRVIITIVLVLLVMIGVTLLALTPQFERDPPRALPWQLPDYRAAHTAFSILPDGRLRFVIEHLPLPGVTPEMVAWFYQQLPLQQITIAGTQYPLYHVFHPSEHGRIWIKEPAVDGTPGMGSGALVARNEWFAGYNSSGAGRIGEFSAAGFDVYPELLGFSIGKIQHHFQAVPGGTRYWVEGVLGITQPILGNVVNWIIRKQVFPSDLMREWLRHQVEEVSSLPFFLPDFYHSKTRHAETTQTP